ncbi:MAG: MscL family protein [Gemmatimonadaceae bacterium]|jgi:large conductance mechanosensitive channel|nr:MscL family protein [Gemmatimonadaceae bacterium]
MSEFRAFLKEYGVIGLALGVIIGGKAGDLVKSIADGILMPIVGLAIPSGEWQKIAIPLKAGAPPESGLQIGAVLAALLNFVIVAYFVFWVSKKLLREEKVAKK